MTVEKRGGKRTGAGRPVLVKNGIQICVRVDADLLAKMGPSRSEFTRQAIIEKINRNAKRDKKV
jgi:hypothetical protein